MLHDDQYYILPIEQFLSSLLKIFLHNRYRDLKRLLKQVEDGRAVNAARLAAESLVQVLLHYYNFYKYDFT